MQLRWHNEDPGSPGPSIELQLLDRDPADDLIDMAAVRRYRLGRVREEMGNYGVDACLLFLSLIHI